MQQDVTLKGFCVEDVEKTVISSSLYIHKRDRLKFSGGNKIERKVHIPTLVLKYQQFLAKQEKATSLINKQKR